MKLKKLLSFAAACAMAVTATLGAITASADDSDWMALGNQIMFYLGTDTDIVLPTELNSTDITSIMVGTFMDTNITSVIVPEGYIDIEDSVFSGCGDLRSVSLPNTLTTLGNKNFFQDAALVSVNVPEKITSIEAELFSGCTNPDLVIDIQSTSLTSVGNNVFDYVTGTIQVYSQEMYNVILEAVSNSTDSTAKVVLIGVAIDYTALDEAIALGETTDTSKYSKALATALAEAIAAGKAVKENTEATQIDIDNATTAIKEAIANLKIDYTALDNAIAAGEALIAEDYTTDSYTALSEAIEAGKAAKENTEATQEDIDKAAEAITTAIEALVLVDTTDIEMSLLELSEKVEKLLTIKTESNYTSESWTALSEALTAAKTGKGLTISGYTALYNDLSNAYSGLTIKSVDSDSEYIATIYGGYETTYNHQTDSYKIVVSDDVDLESVVGTTYVKVTFTPNKADFQYQIPYGTLRIWNFLTDEASYTKLDGSADNVLTYSLSIPSATSAFSLTAGTGWKSTEEVFYVKSVEFYNSSDELLYTYDSSKVVIETATLDELKEAIAAAEELNRDDYTAESLDVLDLILEEAKAIAENGADESADYIVVISEIEAAIKSLEEKPTEPPTEPDPSQPEPTKPEPSKPTTKTPAKTTAAAKATRSAAVVAKDKAAAVKLMKQAKIKKLTVKSKAKKKINVTWKKVKKAVGYEVQISNKKNFKKLVLTKTTAKKKLTIKNKKLKSGKKYYVRVRAYATYKDANGTAVKVYSNWNKKLRKVTVK